MKHITLPSPHQGQQKVQEQAKRFNWLAAGRRWRKTTLAMAIAVDNAARGAAIIWGAPVYDQVRVGWTETEQAAGGYADFHITRKEVAFPGGGVIYFRSLDDPDNVRGRTADGVVIDEVGYVKQAAWYEVLRPMLIDTGGWSWGIGTPRGRNWFWHEWHKAGDDNETTAWQSPTVGAVITENGLERKPHPLENPDIPFNEIQRLYETMPERIFRQEILAEFIESSGGIFRGVMQAATAQRIEPVEDHEYVFGVDWGKHNDFTVIAVIDAETSAMVAMERFRQIDYQLQVGRLKALYDRYAPSQIVAERNAMGEPLVEQLQREGLPVEGFTTTNASKAQAIDGLALAIEKQELEILNDPDLVGELQGFEAHRLPSGMLRYQAPEGMHDDCVMALALAWHGMAMAGPWVAIL